MVKTKPKTVDEILAKVDGEEEKKIANSLRALVKESVPMTIEIVRQGRLTYTINGKDFAGIRPANGHVDLLFFQSASLSSPHLKGQGTIGDPKHIIVVKLKNFEVTEAKRLLKEAAALS
jgi:hypothetical protein